MTRYPDDPMPRCLVLSAGLGTRLDPITRLVAKPAVPVGARALVEHVLTWLAAQGVRDTVINLHHRPETITGIVGDGASFGLRVRYSWEEQVLGSAGGPRHALGLLGDSPFLIVNGDTRCEIDLAPLVDAHSRSGADVTMAVVPNTRPAHYNGIRADADGTVRAFVPKGHRATGQTDDTWHFVGIQLASPRVFADLPDHTPADTVAGFYRDMVANTPGRIRIQPVEGTFIDVGTARDYLDAALCTPEHSTDPTARATVDGARRLLIWAEADVDPRATLTNCIVAGPVRVPRNLSAHDTVIVPASVVRSGDAATIAGDLALFPMSVSVPVS